MTAGRVVALVAAGAFWLACAWLAGVELDGAAVLAGIWSVGSTVLWILAGAAAFALVISPLLALAWFAGGVRRWAQRQRRTG